LSTFFQELEKLPPGVTGLPPTKHRGVTGLPPNKTQKKKKVPKKKKKLPKSLL
jgi:hypothetical protein